MDKGPHHRHLLEISISVDQSQACSLQRTTLLGELLWSVREIQTNNFTPRGMYL